MAAARKVCPKPRCPHLQPCPDHPVQAWRRTTPRSQLSGSAQQARAARIIARDHGTCHVCHQPGADTADHVIPVTEGGPDTEANMAAIHAEPCHRRKTAAEAARARARARTARRPPRGDPPPPPPARTDEAC